MTERVGSCDSAGDRDAQWRALAAVRDDAVRSLRAGVVDADDVEDSVHEAMLRLCGRSLESLEPARLRAVLIRAATYVAIDGHRRRGTLRRLLPLLLQVDNAASPDEIVADRSEARWLAAGLPDLGALERGALLQAMAGSRVDEIAAALGIEYKAAENALGRARRKLRMRASAVTLGITALLRRLRDATDHGAAVNASALAAAVLLLGGGSTPVTAVATAPPPRPGSIAVVPAQLATDMHRTAAGFVAARATLRRLVRQQPISKAAPTPQPSPSPSPSLVPLQNCGSHVPNGVWVPALNPVYSEATCLTQHQQTLNG